MSEELKGNEMLEAMERLTRQDAPQPETPAPEVEPVSTPVIEAEPAPEATPAQELQPEEPQPEEPQPENAPAPKPEKKPKKKRENKRKQKKAEAKEDLEELARERKADRKRYRMERRQRKLAEKEKYPTAKLRRKARRLRWKQQRQDRRQALRDKYRDAPWIVRVPRLYLVKPLIALLVLFALAGCAYMGLQMFLGTYIDTAKNKPVSQDKIYEISPIDEEGAKRIDAAAPVGKDDTWTISVYLIGSNLEDMGENDLSSLVWSQVKAAREEQAQKSYVTQMGRLDNFSSELDKNKLDLPAYLYYPEKPVPREEESEGPVLADMPGFASTDIGEMTAETWSDNIRIVIQTGGAMRWSNTMVNPNRTQRFEYYKGEFKEVYDQPLQNPTDPKTLTSFMDFCRTEYPADHNMLILWNHGGGAFGYGSDSIYGGMMSLADIRESLEGAFKPSDKDPAYDIIGFDACLMSSLEVTHALDGFADYYAVSAETEPGDGWDYTPWLKAMTKDPTMSPARVCREIADSYTDHYMTQNVNIGWLLSNDVTFSVVDAKKASKLYDAWCDLSKKQLIDATEDSSVLAEIGRCSKKSTYYVASFYNGYNTLDLGNYMDHMVDTYPAEASRIKKLLDETVIYHRQNGSLSDSQGMSVYTPGSVEDFSGLAMCLEYIYDICDDPATRALYYYKVAGCLNEDMEKYLATLTDKKIKPLNTAPFDQFIQSEPATTETGFVIPVDTELQNMLQSYEVEIGVYDEEEGTIINYGRDELARLDGEGSLDCEFDGTWICFDGEPLATEVVSSTESGVEYRSQVIYNGKDAYLSFNYDRDTEKYTINGIRIKDSTGGLLNEDPVNYLTNSRMNNQLKPGDTIVPVYEVSQSGDADSSQDTSSGKTITVRQGSDVKEQKLPSGYYLTAAVVSDYRGDVYYSQVVGNKVSVSGVKSREVDSDFVGRDY